MILCGGGKRERKGKEREREHTRTNGSQRTTSVRESSFCFLALLLRQGLTGRGSPCRLGCGAKEPQESTSLQPPQCRECSCVAPQFLFKCMSSCFVLMLEHQALCHLSHLPSPNWILLCGWVDHIFFISLSLDGHLDWSPLGWRLGSCE